MITYLLYAGWNPLSATEWDTTSDITQDRHGWNFSSTDFCAMDQAVPLISEFVDSLACRQWRAAAKHSCGGGLE